MLHLKIAAIQFIHSNLLMYSIQHKSQDQDYPIVISVQVLRRMKMESLHRHYDILYKYHHYHY